VNGSLLALPPPAPPAGISNLAVRDKEATIFRVDLTLNQELRERPISR